VLILGRTWSGQRTVNPDRRYLGTTRVRRIPPTFPGYPVRVFLDPGILHRNSGTKSRAIILALVASLERRDSLSTGGILGPVSLGQGPLVATRSWDAARRVDRASSGRLSTPSSLARCCFRRSKVVLGKRPPPPDTHGGMGRNGHKSSLNAFKKRVSCNNRAICGSSQTTV
jgi:hypothetical protein